MFWCGCRLLFSPAYFLITILFRRKKGSQKGSRLSSRLFPPDILYLSRFLQKVQFMFFTIVKVKRNSNLKA